MKKILFIAMIIFSITILQTNSKTGVFISYSKTDNISLPDGVIYKSIFKSKGDPPVEMLPEKAAKILWGTALVNILDNNSYSRMKPITLSWVGLFDVDGTECYLFEVSNYENNFAVSYDGSVWELVFGKGLRYWGGMPKQTNEYVVPKTKAMPQLKIDISGLEYEHNDNEELDYWLDDLLYIRLNTYYPFINKEEYTTDSMRARIEELIGNDIKKVTLGVSEEHSLRLGVPVWKIIYDYGENEDARHSTDLYFKTAFGEYWVHTETPSDYAVKYRREIERRFKSVILLSQLGIDTSGMESLSVIGTEWTLDYSLFVDVQSFIVKNKVHSKNSVTSRIKSLEGKDSKFELISVELSNKYTTQINYPVWIIKYFTGSNEDTNQCVDLYFQTESGEYRIHTIVDADGESYFEDEIKKIFDSAKLEIYHIETSYLTDK